MSKALVISCGVVWLCLPLVAGEPRISGQYVEARDCDVWTGPCFSNGEANVRGDHGVMGWIVERGEWQGVRLDGLAVVAVVDAEGTLATPSEGTSRAVVFVDSRAGKAEEHALVELARELSPRYLRNVVKVHRSPIRFQREGLEATLEVGRRVLAKVRTVAIDPVRDRHCGNEAQAYPPLSEGARVECAKTVEHFYRGSELGVRWRHPNARSAMVGTFAL